MAKQPPQPAATHAKPATHPAATPPPAASSDTTAAPANADHVGTGQQPPPMSGEELAARSRAICLNAATLTPGATKFGTVPAAKLRIDEALGRVLAKRQDVAQARNVLEDLRGEIVTGSNPPVNGAQSILGADLEAYEAIIGNLEIFFAALHGE